jgi:hypothetical protein
MATKPVFLAHTMKMQPSINKFKAITIPSVQKFHSFANCLYRESKTPGVEGIEFDSMSECIDMLIGIDICINQLNIRFTTEQTEKLFTVRPVSLWMDKLLETERSKQVTESHSPTVERQVVEKTVIYGFD